MTPQQEQACDQALRMGADMVRHIVRGEQTVRIAMILPYRVEDLDVTNVSLDYHTNTEEIEVNHRLMREYIQLLVARDDGRLASHETDAIDVYNNAMGLRSRSNRPPNRQEPFDAHRWAGTQSGRYFTMPQEEQRERELQDIRRMSEHIERQQREDEAMRRTIATNRQRHESASLGDLWNSPLIFSNPLSDPSNWTLTPGTIPPATSTQMGGVRAGQGLEIGPDGTVGLSDRMNQQAQARANRQPSSLLQGLARQYEVSSQQDAALAAQEYLPQATSIHSSNEAPTMTTETPTPFDWAQPGSDAVVLRRLTRQPYTEQSFVRPKIDEETNAPARRQNWKRGMLVHVEREQSSWGSVSSTDDFIGVILAKEGDNLTVFPVGGSAYGSARMRVDNNGHALIRAENGNIRVRGSATGKAPGAWGVVRTLSARNATLVDPAKLERLWWDTTQYFRLSFVEANKVNYTPFATRMRMEDISKRGKFKKFRYDNSDLRAVSHTSSRTANKLQGQRRAKALGYLAKMEAADLEFDSVAYYNVTDMDLNASVRDRWNRKHGTQNDGSPHPFYLQQAHCGHYLFWKHKHELYEGYHACSTCNANPEIVVPALTVAGDDVRVLRNHVTIYTWSDETVRVSPEPPIVGNYHHAKNLVKKLPTIDGKEYNGVTVGVEIEMENSNHAERFDKYAPLLKRRLDAATPEAWKTMPKTKQPRYAFFERDGSVNWGFEMVTAYGDPEVHRHFISRAFGLDEKGKMPFAKKLHAFDAESSCGIHVHLTKPKTVTHAVKLQAFFNDPEHRRLVRAVARRYSGNYSKYDESRNAKTAAKLTSTLIKGAGWSKDRPKNQYQSFVEEATGYVGNGDRYQVVNLTGRNTVEIRAYKSSMLPTTIIACIEFSVMAWLYTRDVKSQDMSVEHFLAFISKVENRKESRYLRSYLAVRGFKCFVPKPAPGAPEMLTEFNCDEA